MTWEVIKVPYRQRLHKRGRSDAKRESGNNPEVTISDFKKEELWEEKQKKKKIKLKQIARLLALGTELRRLLIAVTKAR